MKFRTCVLWMVVFLLAAAGLATAQQQYGTLTGTVTDEQGGVLPGASVTLRGEALIGGSQTQVTGAGGIYTFRTLSPGTYSVLYEMAGFSPLSQEDVTIAVARVTTVRAEMRVGGLEETITVTGESPIVDVRQNITSTNIDADLYETIPTARNPW